MLLKYFLQLAGLKDGKAFNHDLKKIYKKLKEIYTSFPANDVLIRRVHKNLEDGGIRFYQPNVEYQRTSPREVQEYALKLITWWRQNHTTIGAS
jgi:hypothetical protein